MNRPRRILWIKIIHDDCIRELLEEQRLQIARSYKRFAAFLIDVGLVGFVAYYIMVIRRFGYSGFGATSIRDLWPDMAFFFCLLMIVYNLICIPIFKRTIGTWILGITLMSMNGERINCIQAVMRGGVLGMMTVGIFPYIVILHSVFLLFTVKSDPFRRTFWDIGSHTIIVEKAKEEMGDPQ